jgi:HEAT repeat protein
MGVKFLKQLLSDDHAEVRYTAAASIVAIGGEMAATEVSPLLRSQEVRLRNTVVEILAKIGPEAIGRVAELLQDRDKDVRKFAVDVLEKIGSKEAETPLIQALMDDNVNVSAAAAAALGTCGTQKAVPYLIECLNQSSWQKCAALRGLGAIGGDSALDAILAVDPEEESMVLFSAVSALGDMADSRSIDFLLDLLDRANPSLEPVIMQAIESVFRGSYIKKLDLVYKKIKIQKIIPMLDSVNSETVKSAIGLLGLLRAEESVEALAKLFTESNRSLLEDLEQALLQIKPFRLQPLLKIIGNDKEPDSVKKSAVRIIASTGHKDCMEALISCLKNAGGSLKVDIIKAMATLSDPKAVAPLESLLTDPGDTVRITAIEALETFKATSSIKALFNLKRDRSESVRTAAAQSLATYNLSDFIKDIAGFLGDKDPVIIGFGLELIPDSMGNEFEKEILRMCRHSDGDVRRPAVKKAGRLQSVASFEAVVTATSDTDEKVRLAAVRAMTGKDEKKAAKCLIGIAKNDPAQWNRYEAIQAIGRLALKQLQPELLNLLENASDLVKAAIIDVLGLWGTREHRKIVEQYVATDNDLLRNAALEALEKIEE